MDNNVEMRSSDWPRRPVLDYDGDPHSSMVLVDDAGRITINDSMDDTPIDQAVWTCRSCQSRNPVQVRLHIQSKFQKLTPEPVFNLRK